jgi:hypothetical protein
VAPYTISESLPACPTIALSRIVGFRGGTHAECGDPLGKEISKLPMDGAGLAIHRLLCGVLLVLQAPLEIGQLVRFIKARSPL